MFDINNPLAQVTTLPPFKMTDAAIMQMSVRVELFDCPITMYRLGNQYLVHHKGVRDPVI